MKSESNCKNLIQTHERFKRTLFIRTKTPSANFRGTKIGNNNEQGRTPKICVLCFILINNSVPLNLLCVLCLWILSETTAGSTIFIVENFSKGVWDVGEGGKKKKQKEKLVHFLKKTLKQIRRTLPSELRQPKKKKKKRRRQKRVVCRLAKEKKHQYWDCKISDNTSNRAGPGSWERGITLARWERGRTLARWERGRTLARWERGITLARWERGRTLARWERGTSGGFSWPLKSF